MVRWIPVCLAILALTLVGSPQARAKDGAVGFWTINLLVEAQITDTNYIPHPMLIGPPSLSGVDLVLTSVQTESGDAVPPLVLKALRQAKNRVEASTSCRAEVTALLKAHRRPLGVGVHGPLHTKGKLFLVIVPKGDGTRLSAVLTPNVMSGPKGSWSSGK